MASLGNIPSWRRLDPSLTNRARFFSGFVLLLHVRFRPSARVFRGLQLAACGLRLVARARARARARAGCPLLSGERI